MKSSTKKNVTLLGVGAALCLATAASLGAMSVGKASAAVVTGEEGHATVTYENGSSWSVTIPDTITVGTPTQITASDVNTVNGLTITVSSENEFTLQNEGGANIPYELKIADEENGLTDAVALSQNGTVLTVDGGENQSNSIYIGAYVESDHVTGEEPATDTLTFTIAEN